VEFRSLQVASLQGPAPGGWLPDDELTQEWLRHMKDYRTECDAADRAQLDTETDESEQSA
jgi:hypothetical protein